MRVAVDAMGGDFAPAEVVKGAVIAAEANPDLSVILVGIQEQIEAELSQSSSVPSNVSVYNASEVIAMDDSPATAVRKKRNSSLVVAGQMVKNGEADATFSAGNTGAAMAIATLEIGRIPGIDRPAIATAMPTMHGQMYLLDVGANVDCSPDNLVQFAIMGSVYSQKVNAVENPRVGLLNIGGEAGKGNELTKEVYERLKSSPINFIGNVEGRDMFEGVADVVVCDGFVGNVMLKASEGVAEFLVGMIQKELVQAGVGKEVLQAFGMAMGRLKSRIDYAEYGGAPFLGVNGVSLIGHGRSHATAIASGINAAARAAESNYVQTIRETIKLNEGNR